MRYFVISLWPKTNRERWYFWLLAPTLVLLFVLWRREIAPVATIWGDVGTWVAGLGTVVGLVYASLSLQGQTKQRVVEELRRAEDKRSLEKAHARQVAVSSAWKQDKYNASRMRIELELINASPYPIDGVVLLIPRGGMERRDNDQTELVVGTVLPGERISEKREWVDDVHVPFALMVDCVQVRFTDTWGNHWLRGPSNLEEMVAPAMTC